MRFAPLLLLAVASTAWAGPQDAGTFTGTIDEAEVRKVIARNGTQVRFCYEMQKMKTPELRGHVVLQFVITASGRPSRIAVTESSLKNAAVESCLVARFQSWTFPKPSGGEVLFTFPFTFGMARDI